jgi:hypothetical protein
MKHLICVVTCNVTSRRIQSAGFFHDANRAGFVHGQSVIEWVNYSPLTYIRLGHLLAGD